MPLPPIVIVGSAGHARVVLDVVHSEGRYCVAGFIDSFKQKGSCALGLEVLGSEADLAGLYRSGKVIGALVAIGDNWIRSKVAQTVRAMEPEFHFITAIHPASTIGADVIIGDGTVVMAGAIVNPGCRLGEGCIVNTKASLDHDSTLGDFASLAPGVTTGGNVAIGRCTSVGIGATLFHGITLGAHTVVGGGSLVRKDMPDDSVVYGSPARVVRSREPDERYL